jgi:hypothetical protein
MDFLGTPPVGRPVNFAFSLADTNCWKDLPCPSDRKVNAHIFSYVSEYQCNANYSIVPHSVSIAWLRLTMLFKTLASQFTVRDRDNFSGPGAGLTQMVYQVP